MLVVIFVFFFIISSESIYFSIYSGCIQEFFFFISWLRSYYKIEWNKLVFLVEWCCYGLLGWHFGIIVFIMIQGCVLVNVVLKMSKSLVSLNQCWLYKKQEIWSSKEIEHQREMDKWYVRTLEDHVPCCIRHPHELCVVIEVVRSIQFEILGAGINDKRFYMVLWLDIVSFWSHCLVLGMGVTWLRHNRKGQAATMLCKWWISLRYIGDCFGGGKKMIVLRKIAK